LLALAVIVPVVVARLVPHPPNFTPVTAAALFAAANFRSRWLGVAAPLVAMLLSDAALEACSRLGWLGGWMADGRGFHEGMWVVYATVALIGCLGFFLRDRKSVPAVGVVVLGSSGLFFLVTNFAWWAGYDLYPHTLEGLITSYEKALPFYRRTALGDALFATAYFGGFALAERLLLTRRAARVAATRP